MIKINISEFQNYECKGIYEFLSLQVDNELEITIPRKAVERISNNYELVDEYLSAAYAGQIISEIATSFAYYTPCPGKTSPFYFQAVISDIEKLAEALYMIIQGFYDPEGEEVFLAFHGNAADFLNDAYDNRINCCTWGLLHIANSFLQK